MTTRIAHDLNELLAPLLGNVAVLEEEIPGAHPLRECVESLHKAIVDVRTFAQRLMAIDVRRELVLEIADLTEVVRDVLAKVAEVLGPQVDLGISFPDALAKVRVDRGQIEQALLELVHNARAAMPAGGSLALDLAQVEGGAFCAKLPPGRWLRLRVRDSGCGMEPGLLARAFEPFVTTKVAGRGAGLGLAAVYAITRQNSGESSGLDCPSHAVAAGSLGDAGAAGQAGISGIVGIGDGAGPGCAVARCGIGGLGVDQREAEVACARAHAGEQGISLTAEAADAGTQAEPPAVAKENAGRLGWARTGLAVCAAQALGPQRYAEPA